MKKARNFLIIFAVLLGLVFGCGKVLADPAEKIDTKIEELKTRLSVLSGKKDYCETLSGKEMIACINEIMKEMNEVMSELKKYESEIGTKAENLQKDVKSLSNQIGYLNAKVEKTEVEVRITQQEIDMLNLDIAKIEEEIKLAQEEITKTESKIEEAKQRLADTIKKIYEYDTQNLVKITLNKGTISDFFNEISYLENLQKSLSANLDQLKQEKKDLEDKKTALENQKAGLAERREEVAEKIDSYNKTIAELDASKREKAILLEITKGDEAEYQKLLEKIKKEKAIADNALRDLYELSIKYSTDIGTGGTGGYPYYNQCDQADPWLFLTCQCTSYAAWKWNMVWGYPWHNTQPGRGHAKYWAAEIAPVLGYSTGSSPREKAIIVWTNGTYGHVAIVEKVFPDKSIIISEYNFIPLGGESYSQRTIPPSLYANATFIYPK